MFSNHSSYYQTCKTFFCFNTLVVLYCLLILFICFTYMCLFTTNKFKKNVKVENDLILKWYSSWYLVFYFSIWMQTGMKSEAMILWSQQNEVYLIVIKDKDLEILNFCLNSLYKYYGIKIISKINLKYKWTNAKLPLKVLTLLLKFQVNLYITIKLTSW